MTIPKPYYVKETLPGSGMFHAVLNNTGNPLNPLRCSSSGTELQAFAAADYLNRAYAAGWQDHAAGCTVESSTSSPEITPVTIKPESEVP